MIQMQNVLSRRIYRPVRLSATRRRQRAQAPLRHSDFNAYQSVNCFPPGRLTPYRYEASPWDKQVAVLQNVAHCLLSSKRMNTSPHTA